MKEKAKAWGSADRYYSAKSDYRPDEEKSSASLREGVKKLLHAHDPTLRERVQRSLKQWNLTIREHLRNETGLRLSGDKDIRSVPVEVHDGLPVPFANLIEEWVDELWLLLRRPQIMLAADNLRTIESGYERLTKYAPLQPLPATAEETSHVRELLERIRVLLERFELLKRIGSIDQDLLGAYFFCVPKVHLYWMVIGIVAATLGVSVEALTIVVMAHELAHAYTHLGRDIDGGRWDTGAFAAAHVNIVEGLAQFYTAVVCRRLAARLPDVWGAFEALLKVQSGPYTVHVGWTAGEKASGEIVRVSMIECRSRAVLEYHELLAMLARHQQQISGEGMTPASRARIIESAGD